VAFAHTFTFFSITASQNGQEIDQHLRHKRLIPFLPFPSTLPDFHNTTWSSAWQQLHTQGRGVHVERVLGGAILRIVVAEEFGEDTSWRWRMSGEEELEIEV
jgi:hypothetical protein